VADLSFDVVPMQLADALYNAVVLSEDSGGKPGCPHVMICYQAAPNATVGVVVVYGASRLIAGRTSTLLDTRAPNGYATVVIHRDKANEIQSALRGFGRAKTSRVGVRISEEGYETVTFTEDGEPEVSVVNLCISKGSEEPLAELSDSDPEGLFQRHFDIVDQYLIESGDPLQGPCLLSFEAIKRVTALKGLGSTTLDFARTARPGILALGSGARFRGILGELDRDVYMAQGGRDGHLLD